MSTHYIYKMEIVDSDTHQGIYIGQHKIGSKDPSCDGYKGSGCKWKREVLRNHIPVKKTILRLCDGIRETNFWEQYYVEQAIQSGEILWNVVKGGGGHEYGRAYTDEEIKAHEKQRFYRWYDANQEHVVNYRRKYYEDNKERLYSAKRENEKRHKEYYAEYHREYYKRNREHLAEKNKQYYEQHKDHLNELGREYGKQYRATHAEKLAEKGRKYYAENREKHLKYYSRPCCYDGKTLTFGALTLRFRRMHVVNPTQEAKKYLISKGE